MEEGKRRGGKAGTRRRSWGNTAKERKGGLSLHVFLTLEELSFLDR